MSVQVKLGFQATKSIKCKILHNNSSLMNHNFSGKTTQLRQDFTLLQQLGQTKTILLLILKQFHDNCNDFSNG